MLIVCCLCKPHTNNPCGKSTSHWLVKLALLFLLNVVFFWLKFFFQGDWIRKRFESPGIVSLDAEDKKTCLKRLIRSTGYDIKSLTACIQYCL